ncbi:phosphotransferase family protein [Streptomyces sp. NBC_01190]|uniref:phosphotransferase family protein n=1 Tax=Streptomyces sp. NBC_01190 TaxID=2903767 RepID=UPI00386CB0F1|nr:aminoglycoside phosphotransferase family protein [Streptomyces sp. NBC_01190]
MIPAEVTEAVRAREPSPAAGPLVAALAAHAAEAAHRAARASATPPAPRGPRLPAPAPVVLADRPDATVVRVGAAVAKAHPADTDPVALRTRLAVAAHPLLRGILLPPYPLVGQELLATVQPSEGVAAGDRAEGAERPAVAGRRPRDGSSGARPVSVWPYGHPVDPGDPAAAPWEAAAALLARLHAVPPGRLPGRLPVMRGPAKAARAMARLAEIADRDDAAVRTVRRAWRGLPAWARDEAPYEGRSVLCHGDWHLGQLVRHPAPDGDWLLIDVDDLGVGEPAWDLARPAMWFAAGLLAPEVWARFLGAYQAAGGPAAGAGGDPWARLDVPARTLAVQGAAIAVTKAALGERELDEAGAELLAACARIAQLK